MRRMLQRCFTPMRTADARVLIGGGALSVILFGKAVFAYAPNLV